MVRTKNTYNKTKMLLTKSKFKNKQLRYTTVKSKE